MLKNKSPIPTKVIISQNLLYYSPSTPMKKALGLQLW